MDDSNHIKSQLYIKHGNGKYVRLGCSELTLVPDDYDVQVGVDTGYIDGSATFQIKLNCKVFFKKKKGNKYKRYYKINNNVNRDIIDRIIRGNIYEMCRNNQKRTT